MQACRCEAEGSAKRCCNFRPESCVSGGGRWGHYGGTRWGHPANSRWQRVDHPESKLASEGESAPSAVTGDPNNSFERRASPSNSQACLCEAKQELKQPTGSEENNHEIPEDFA